MTRVVEDQKFIDFKKSKLKWITKDNSEAYFSIESTCYEKDTNINWLISSSVLAGNVFTNNVLPKIPMYHFTWALSEKGNMILRQYSNHQDNNYHKTNLLKTVEIFCEYIQPKAIESFNQLLEAYDNNSNFFTTAETSSLLLTFPVKHLNINRRKKLFQVETGPVLFRKENNYFPAFLHFNNYNTLFISLNYPCLLNNYIIEKSQTTIFYY